MDKKEETKNEDYTSKVQEIVIFYGSPGAGKSTLWKNYFSNYTRVNNDTLKTPAKCIAVCEQAVKDGKSVVIDNTNSTLEMRSRFTKIGKEHKV